MTTNTQIKPRKLFVIISILLFFSFSYIDVTRNHVGQFSAYKYATICLMLFAFSLNAKKPKFDSISLASLIFFLTLTSFFTFFNLYHPLDIITLFGYFACTGLYFATSKSPQEIRHAISFSVSIFGPFFVFVTLLSISDPDSYSVAKSQFQGNTYNPNAFAGLCGLLAIFYLDKLFFSNFFSKKTIYLILFLMLVAFLLIAFSRSALLATFLATIFLLFKRGLTKKTIATLCCLALFGLLASALLDGFSAAPQRDIFEQTGRASILEKYIERLEENYYVLGTGLSLDAGRFKSELAYLDLILFSGIGAVGFFTYIARNLYLSIKKINPTSYWEAAAFIYICLLSVFEGYAANTGSILSVLLYILPAIVAEKSRNTDLKERLHQSNSTRSIAH